MVVERGQEGAAAGPAYLKLGVLHLKRTHFLFVTGVGPAVQNITTHTFLFVQLPILENGNEAGPSSGSTSGSSGRAGQ